MKKVLRRLCAGGLAAAMSVGMWVSASSPALASSNERCTTRSPAPWPPTVTRVQGADRFGTAVEISKSVDLAYDTVFVANGMSFADALSASTAGYGPLLLVTESAVPDVTRQELERRKPKHIVVLGGTGVVSDAVYGELSKLTPDIVRLSGKDRYETNRAAIEYRASNGQVRSPIAITTGRDFPDALAAARWQSTRGRTLVLVDGQAAELDATANASLDLIVANEMIPIIQIIGGSGAVSAGIESAVQAKVKGVESSKVYRIGGKDRYQTSAALLPDRFGVPNDNGKCTGILVTGSDFPDALAAVPYLVGQPLWVIPPTCIPSSVLKKMKEQAIEQVTLIGGPGALSPAVEQLTTC